MFKVSNQAEFNAGAAAWFKAAEETALSVYRGMAAFAFGYIVQETPQWTGESVSNWRMSIGSPMFSPLSGFKMARAAGRKAGVSSTVWNKQGFGGGDPQTEAWGSGGNPAAMEIARGSLRSAYKAIKTLDQPIYLTNATKFNRGDVTDLERGGTWLREVNRPGAMIGRAVSYMTEQFSRIDAGNLKRLMVQPA